MAALRPRPVFTPGQFRSCGLVVAAVLVVIAVGSLTSKPSAAPTPVPDVRRVTAEAVGKPLASGDDVRVQVRLTNPDPVAHGLRVQANFYRVPLAQLGTDPATFLVTAGTNTVTLAPGASQTIQISAKNFNHDPVLAADFTVSAP